MGLAYRHERKTQVMKLNICIILAVLLAIFLILFLCTHLSTWPNGDAPVLPGPPKQDYGTIKERMKFHGVRVVKMDLEGRWRFHRDGKIYLLW